MAGSASCQLTSLGLESQTSTSDNLHEKEPRVLEDTPRRSQPQISWDRRSSPPATKRTDGCGFSWEVPSLGPFHTAQEREPQIKERQDCGSLSDGLWEGPRPGSGEKSFVGRFLPPGLSHKGSGLEATFVTKRPGAGSGDCQWKTNIDCRHNFNLYERLKLAIILFVFPWQSLNHSCWTKGPGYDGYNCKIQNLWVLFSSPHQL